MKKKYRETGSGSTFSKNLIYRSNINYSCDSKDNKLRQSDNLTIIGSTDFIQNIVVIVLNRIK